MWPGYCKVLSPQSWQPTHTHQYSRLSHMCSTQGLSMLTSEPGAWCFTRGEICRGCGFNAANSNASCTQPLRGSQQHVALLFLVAKRHAGLLQHVMFSTSLLTARGSWVCFVQVYCRQCGCVPGCLATHGPHSLPLCLALWRRCAGDSMSLCTGPGHSYCRYGGNRSRSQPGNID